MRHLHRLNVLQVFLPSHTQPKRVLQTVFAVLRYMLFVLVAQLILLLRTFDFVKDVFSPAVKLYLICNLLLRCHYGCASTQISIYIYNPNST